MKRNGKIAHLPFNIREQLNRRLDAGESAATILPWLNADSDVQSVLNSSFAGAPVSAQNLSEWRKGGLLEWRMNEELQSDVERLSGQAIAVGSEPDHPVVDDVATVLSARYAGLLADWDGEPNPKLEARLRILRAMCRDVVCLQRSIHNAEKQNFEQRRRDEEEDEKCDKKFKERTIAGLLEPRDGGRCASMYGGGKGGEIIARIIYRLNHDLPLDGPPLPAASPSPAKPAEPAEPAEPATNPTEIKPNPSESNQIKPLEVPDVQPPVSNASNG